MSKPPPPAPSLGTIAKTTRISAELNERLRVASFMTRKTSQEIFTEAILAWLAEFERDQDEAKPPAPRGKR